MSYISLYNFGKSQRKILNFYDTIILTNNYNFNCENYRKVSKTQMFCLIHHNALPLRHISSGQLVSRNGFVHPDRNIDTFVIIICDKGTLHISQDGREFSVGENQYILLFPGIRHFSTKPSTGILRYSWCHFQMLHGGHRFVNQEYFDNQIQSMHDSGLTSDDHYVIPELGTLNSSERVSLIYRQLLDSSKRDSYSEHYANYALSLLAMEISIDFAVSYNKQAIGTTARRISEIMEWVRVNYDNNISVKKVADQFHYTPNYLSNSFKKYTGQSLCSYINRAKLDIAKRWLLNTGDPIKKIASYSGFKDEKHFMKVFKQFEGITPSQYRGAFYRKHLNKQ